MSDLSKPIADTVEQNQVPTGADEVASGVDELQNTELPIDASEGDVLEQAEPEPLDEDSHGA